MTEYQNRLAILSRFFTFVTHITEPDLLMTLAMGSLTG